MDHEHHKEFEVGEINIMNICPKNNSQNDSKKKGCVASSERRRKQHIHATRRADRRKLNHDQ